MQREIKEHPEILEQPVKRPLIIVGAPRTGTTLVNHLLSQDPVSRPLLTWEAVCSPPMLGPWKRDLRLPLTAHGVRMTKRFVPDLARMHPFEANIPDECHWLLWPAFVWPPAMIVPSMREWFIEQPESTYDNAYLIYRQALQMLHYQRPAEGHWVLKSPLHVWALGSLMRVVPEASIVHTHRTLTEVMPSYCSLAAVMANIFSDAVEPESMGPVAMELTRIAIDRFEKARSENDPARICDVRYTDLVADPIAAVRSIYDALDYSFTPEFEQRLNEYLEKGRRTKRAKHVYSAEQFGLDEQAISEAFADYHDRYGL
jgi:hypothetical protein